MIYKAGSRFRIRREYYAAGNMRSRSGTVIREINANLRRVIRDGLRTPETWHITWFTREHK